MFKVNNKETRTTSLTSFCCLYCKPWTDFTSNCSGVFIVNFKQINTGWVVGLSPWGTWRYCYLWLPFFSCHSRAERIRNSETQFFVYLTETFGARVHHEKMYTSLHPSQKSCITSCTLNEPSLFRKYAYL